MTAITNRSVKGAPLTIAEVDANFANLNTAKAETNNPILTGVVKLDYGTSSLPALTFSSASTTGLYGSNSFVGLCQNALPILELSSSSTVMSAKLSINSTDTGITVAALGGDSRTPIPLTFTSKMSGKIAIFGSNNNAPIAIGPANLPALGSVFVGPDNVDRDTSSRNIVLGYGTRFFNGSNANVVIGYAYAGHTTLATNCVTIGSWEVGDDRAYGLGAGTLGICSVGVGTGVTALNYSTAIGYAASSVGVLSMAFMGSAAADFSVSIGDGAFATCAYGYAFSMDQWFTGIRYQRGLYPLAAATIAGVTPALLSYSGTIVAYSIQVHALQTVAFKGQIIVKDTGASVGFAIFDIAGFASATGLGVIILQSSTISIGAHNGTYATATAANVVLAVAVGGISITVHGLAGTGASIWCGTFDTTEMVG